MNQPDSLFRDRPSGPPTTDNLPEVTVGELSGALKRTIEDRFGLVRVRGEISNYRGPHASGHAYFCLKDESARIDAVVWKTTFQRLKTRPQEGLEVVATGRVTTFPGKSTYQIVIDAIEPAGIGALMAVLEARRKALAAEGLFDENRKRPLPYLPETIGVVTSPTGAVIRDILHRIADRFPRNVLVWPVRVQGESAAAEVAAGIAGFNALALPDVRRPDVLIVARGGGSLEDLWAFNEEVVIRAAVASTIPVVSAVGHETDWTLLDHAADLRAPTPSGAAEKAVPVWLDLATQQNDLARRLNSSLVRIIGHRRSDVRSLARALPSPDSLATIPRQRVDRAQSRLEASTQGAIDRRRLNLVRLAHRLVQQAPRARLTQRQHALSSLEQRMLFSLGRERERRSRQLAQAEQRLASAAFALKRDVGRARDAEGRISAVLRQRWASAHLARYDQLAKLERLLENLGYRQVLARGFALVRDGDGRPLRTVGDVAQVGTLDIEFVDGHIEAAVGRARPRQARPARIKADQGTLF